MIISEEMQREFKIDSLLLSLFLCLLSIFHSEDFFRLAYFIYLHSLGGLSGAAFGHHHDSSSKHSPQHHGQTTSSQGLVHGAAPTAGITAGSTHAHAHTHTPTIAEANKMEKSAVREGKLAHVLHSSKMVSFSE